MMLFFSCIRAIQALAAANYSRPLVDAELAAAAAAAAAAAPAGGGSGGGGGDDEEGGQLAVRASHGSREVRWGRPSARSLHPPAFEDQLV